MLDALLDRLARSRGLGEAYYDYRGELRHISAATKTALLAAMGCNVGDAAAIEHEIAAVELAHWRVGAPPVTVLRPGLAAVPIVVPVEALERSLRWSVRLEDRRVLRGEVPVAGLSEGERSEVGGRHLARRFLILPDHLPSGYHALELSVDDETLADGAVIVAPAHCFEPAVLAAGHRLWGVAVQLYTLRSRRNWGIGDFDDLKEVVRDCASHGAAFVGLNPLHALFAANPAHFSPYSPSSRHFLNAYYIAVPSVPGFADCPDARRITATREFAGEVERLRAADQIDYAGVAAVKLRVLRALYEDFREQSATSTRAQAFRRFREERGEALALHALHEAIDMHLRAQNPDYWGWPAWPESLRDPRSPDARDFAQRHVAEVDFHAWLQWIADEQLGTVQALARALGMPIGLYGDYAVGVNPAGSETWSDQQVYRMGAGVGAPPDALALKGQDWGIPPQDPHALGVDAYRPFRELVAANMRQFGALRLDHVMALFRQWWVPRGFGATQGGYVHYPLDDLMSVLALESERHHCLVVGEDLGTVPDEMRRAMAQYAVYHYKVLLFEKERDGRFVRPGDYVRRAIATVTTHDLPTLRGYWEGRDLVLRDRLHLFPGDEIRQYVFDERARDRAQLLIALRETGIGPAEPQFPDGPWTDELAVSVQRYLARSASALVVLQLEDLIGMTDPVNVPGTRDEHPNWQRKVTADLDEIFGRKSVRDLLAAIARERPG